MSADKNPDAIASMNLWQKLAAITGEVGPISKDGKNEQQNYNFIENAAVAGRLRELYSKYNVILIPDLVDRTERPLIGRDGKPTSGVNVLSQFTFMFVNADKPEEKQACNWEGEASDYADKATGKAATAAQKSFETKFFHISEKGDDPDEITIDGRPAAHFELATAKREGIAAVYAEMKNKGITDPQEAKSALLTLAGVSDASYLSLDAIHRVQAILDTHSADELLDRLVNNEDVEVEA